MRGVPHTTFDLDILIEVSPENAQKLLDALQKAKFGTVTMISAEELLAHETTII